MTKAIEIKNLQHAYGNQRILDNLSFCIQRGDFFIIIGPNGSGKTTLMKIITGITRLQQGEVILLGQTLQQYTQKSLAQKIAYVPQLLPPDFPFTVAQLVLMGRSPYQGLLGLEQEKDFEIAKKAMTFTGVQHLSRRRFSQLSGGEQQRAFIARAISQQPRIILLDEPTTSLDLAHQVRIMDLMERLKIENDITVVMVSHDVNLAAMYADRLLLLKAGRIASLGQPKEVLTYKTLEDAYGCTILVDQSPIGEYPRINLVPQKKMNVDR